jgi:hypothetical protein
MQDLSGAYTGVSHPRLKAFAAGFLPPPHWLRFSDICLHLFPKLSPFNSRATPAAGRLMNRIGCFCKKAPALNQTASGVLYFLELLFGGGVLA